MQVIGLKLLYEILLQKPTSKGKNMFDLEQNDNNFFRTSYYTVLMLLEAGKLLATMGLQINIT